MLIWLCRLVPCQVWIGIILLAHKLLATLSRLSRIKWWTFLGVVLILRWCCKLLLLHDICVLRITLWLHHKVLLLVVLLLLILPVRVTWHELPRVLVWRHPRVGRARRWTRSDILLWRCLTFALHLLVLVCIVSCLKIQLLLHSWWTRSCTSLSWLILRLTCVKWSWSTVWLL
jgi:hypothetical protein